MYKHCTHKPFQHLPHPPHPIQHRVVFVKRKTFCSVEHVHHCSGQKKATQTHCCGTDPTRRAGRWYKDTSKVASGGTGNATRTFWDCSVPLAQEVFCFFYITRHSGSPTLFKKTSPSASLRLPPRASSPCWREWTPRAGLCSRTSPITVDFMWSGCGPRAVLLLEAERTRWPLICNHFCNGFCSDSQVSWEHKK